MLFAREAAAAALDIVYQIAVDELQLRQASPFRVHELAGRVAVPQQMEGTGGAGSDRIDEFPEGALVDADTGGRRGQMLRTPGIDLGDEGPPPGSQPIVGEPRFAPIGLRQRRRFADPEDPC